MRAVFIESLESPQIAQEIQIPKDKSHHFIYVLRIKEGEEILILNGRGLWAYGQVKQIKKSLIRVIITGIEFHKRKYNLDWAVGLTKKDSFDQILGAAAQIGVRKVIPLFTQYSQRRKLNMDRCHKLMASALEQSNHPFMPQLVDPKPFEPEVMSSYDRIFLGSMQKNTSARASFSLDQESSLLCLVGPEGGFSQSEEEMVNSIHQLIPVNLPNHILRTETALNVLSGYVFHQIDLKS